jgi:hypothetical protein
LLFICNVGLQDEVKLMETMQKTQQERSQEAHTVIRKLIHPQAKDYYDEDSENKIIGKSNFVIVM